jgi:hypothetical protein
MKIYTKLVIDMTTDQILEEESFEYNGPVSQCGGGSGGGGGSSMPANTTNITTVREAPGIEERKLGLMDISRALAEQPVNIPVQQIAPLSSLEQQGTALAGQTGVGGAAIQSGIAGLGAAQTASALGPSSAQFNQYLNPYQSFILDEINRQAQIGQNQLSAQAVQAGAFGGGREGIQQAEQERARLQQVGLAQERAFTGALGAFQQGISQQGQLGLGMAQLGQVQQAQQQADINQLMAAGGLQRQLAQQTVDAQRAQQLQQAYEPFQRAEFLKAQYQGGPTSQSGITQTTAPTVNPLAQAAGAGLGAYAAYQTAQASRPVINVGTQPTK